MTPEIFDPGIDKTAWLSVKNLYNEKKVHSLCSICDDFCKSSCICCTTCSFWYHYKCAGVSAYHQKGKILYYSQRSLIRIDSDANKTSTDYFYDLRVNRSFLKKYKKIQNYGLRM